jgi:DNA-binding NarL/FixJ family response regulator
MSGGLIRVLLADDHPMFRNGLAAALAKDVDVVGVVATGDQAVGESSSLRPDVVLMDLRLPIVNGIEATRLIVAANPGIAILVLTMFDDDDSVFAAMRAGARGYLLKESDEEEILRAIRTVHAGGAVFGAGVARRMVGFFSVTRYGLTSAFPTLTVRESEILELIARGRANIEIAQHLSLSEKTVRNNISNIFAKLQVADRSQAIVRAREAGLGTESAPNSEEMGPGTSIRPTNRTTEET